MIRKNLKDITQTIAISAEITKIGNISKITARIITIRAA